MMLIILTIIGMEGIENTEPGAVREELKDKFSKEYEHEVNTLLVEQGLDAKSDLYAQLMEPSERERIINQALQVVFEKKIEISPTRLTEVLRELLSEAN